MLVVPCLGYASAGFVVRDLARVQSVLMHACRWCILLLIARLDQLMNENSMISTTFGQLKQNRNLSITFMGHCVVQDQSE
jgi:hypothetical protein